MSSMPLDYGSPDLSPRRRWWRQRWVIVTAILLLLVLLVPFNIERQDSSRMDPATGSMVRETIWPFGLGSGPRLEVSPLETRLKNSCIAWAPSWQFIHNTHRNLFGQPTCFECGTAPPIYTLHSFLGPFEAASSDAELREFVRVMQTGTEAEQKAAVEAACEKSLQSLRASPP